ncbi:MAG TPA: aminopeptidase N, partial [Croceibacterium sp.]
MVVRREDYRPPAWLVPEIALEFDLDPVRTRVRARLTVVRNGAHREPLRLDGIGLKLRSLTVDGRPASHKLDKSGLTVKLAADRATVETAVDLLPSVAEQQGLFELGGVLCTQCEPEHFRRITFFPDRPDVLSRFSVRIEADKALFSVLLSNGDLRAAGDSDDGRHWAEWCDPHPKPCYLFALVAGQLAARTDSFTTGSGREVALGVWTREADLARAAHAMESLKAVMRWDEDAYGREYDLSRYNLVALPNFRFGAMENKGLAIHDAAQVLADPATATDSELDVVAALVAHEYLHNWSGNRVTCRDWFELSLKEGFTVFRDQGFSADRGSAAVRRIEDVRSLHAAQFVEDAGPRAHPVRPDRYTEVAELFTATVYVKGAEIVRMIRTVLGEAAFRAGADLYFARHDGGAATWEDFLGAMEQAGGASLASFRRWYETVGTPTVTAALAYDPGAEQATLRLSQNPVHPPLPIPLRVALFGAGSGALMAERLVVLEAAEAEFTFAGIGELPALSLNRGFSAPVRIKAARALDELALLASRDDDPFSRHAAMQDLMLAALRDPSSERGPLVEALRQALGEGALDRGLLAELVSLPPQKLVGEGLESVDPGQIHSAWKALRRELGRELEPEWREAQAVVAAGPGAKGARRLRGVALGYLLASGADDSGAMALREFEQAETMTEREDALRALADSDASERTRALAAFHRRYRDDPRLLDKWFALQALSARDDTIETAPRLLAHPDFTIVHPGRLGAVVGAFAANPHAFHDPSGRGYRFLADVTLVLDRSDPRGAARMARSLNDWRR